MLKKIKILIYSNILLSQTLFFSVFAILGLTYQGSGESSIYTLYLVGSALLAYSIFFFELIKRVTFKPVLAIIFAFPVVFLFFNFIAPEHTFVKSQTNLFFVLVLPAAFVGYIVARTDKLSSINRSFIITGTIVFIGVLRVLPRLLSSSVIDLMDVFGGGQYQAFSYFCAFSFLAFFRYFLYQDNLKFWKYLIYIFVLLVLCAGVILSGGRGGLIVVFTGLIVFIIRKKGFLKFFKYFFLSSITIFLLLLFVSKSNFFFSERITESFDRLFSFVSSDGINMEGTSNRDDFYGIALSKISNSLIFGYGIFGLVDSLGEYYPHNIFLEILLQGGIIYLIIFLVIMISFFLKLSLLIRLKKDEDVILIPTIYSVVLLLFSSSYLQEPFFWFSLSYVFSYPFNNLKNKKNEIISDNF
ncbi:O-antigen ligase family protein [Flavobacterium sp. LHD-80]|uniref:O-antigen ligase family protein n=1 Tax=Flavobacterium sp. LHD-80 TaxID=3071411 RepID=UPI0027DEB6AF|nr:O-antigen ligase family protein [Flavobacterium sp. LHD-80]MDQ6472051.1 O-antigen ligase family protein [Flavobacterium sp. LHD-80]